MIGRTISHYRITEKLGEGGMGVVWKAHDQELGRFAAIKCLSAKLSTNSSGRARFFQEARAVSALNHPNIVTVYDLFHEDGATYLVMELVDGKALDRVIPRQGMNVGDLLSIAIQITGALVAAHKAGIVHRDLKPGNIMVTASGQVKVLDFGLAKLLETPVIGATESTIAKHASTEDGAILGTVSYMSPEQAEGKAVDARSDIFSFGAVLYEMATGRRAFHGESKISTLSAILREEPPPVKDVPRDLEKIILRCLKKNPERRTQTVSDVKLSLEELKEETESSQRPGNTIIPKRRKPMWILGAAAAGLLALAGIGLRFFPRETGPAPTLITVTSYEGIERNPALSPDGKQVAFVWEGDDRKGMGVFVKLVGAGRPLRLTTGRDSRPRWSPDGQLVAFARTGSDGGYYVVPALGGKVSRA